MTPPTGSPHRVQPDPSQGRRGSRGGSGGSDEAQEQSYARRHPARVRTFAFLASAAIHLVALLLYPAIEVRFGEVDSSPDSGPTQVDGMEVVNLQELSDEVESPLEPEELAAESQAPVVPLPDAPGEDLAPRVEVSAPDFGPSAAERLRPATLSEELWMPLVPDATALSDQEIIRNLVYRRLAEFNDSMAVRAARAAEGTDWTYTDDEGNRWGVSPGQLHLGSITIPLPFSFGSATGASDDQLDRMLMEREIQRAAGLLRTDQTIRERAAAIKARIDAERARRGMSGDTIGGG